MVARGATSAAACACKAGKFLEGDFTNGECRECNVERTDCREPGVTLQTMPLKAGYTLCSCF